MVTLIAGAAAEFGGWLAAKLSLDGHTVRLTDTVAPAWTSAPNTTGDADHEVVVCSLDHEDPALEAAVEGVEQIVLLTNCTSIQAGDPCEQQLGCRHAAAAPDKTIRNQSGE